MSIVIGGIIIASAFLAIYWVFFGQKKHNEMFMPKKKTELKAIIFDLDGVLLDTFETWFEVFNRCREKYGLKKISEDEFKKKVWGNSLSEEAKIYFKNIDFSKLTKDVYKFREKFNDKTVLMPDAKKILGIIKKKKIMIGLATNNNRRSTIDNLKRHRIDSYFDAIVTADDTEREKPYPDPILKLCNTLDIIPQEAICVGDTKFDYKASKSAGCLFVGFNTHGDLIISRLSDIFELI